MDFYRSSVSFVRVIELSSYRVDRYVDTSNIATPRITLNEVNGPSRRYPPAEFARPTHIDRRSNGLHPASCPSADGAGSG